MAHVHRGAGLHDLPVAGKRSQETARIAPAVIRSPLIVQPLFGVAFVVDVVWRIREHQVGGLAGHQLATSLSIASRRRRAACDRQEPKIARGGDRRLLELRDRILIRQPFGGSCAASNRASSSSSKPIKSILKSSSCKRRQFDAKQFLVPAGV